ncbi:hypothetical protein F5X68DRAFT_141421 [Plectosphaerella plurivora]|uniref:Zn(2)-C6 fungal-type domain-containing protein n=1 Tax=Plectosphaerella plurivora TaxID=936078 RepID=A0A9P8V1K6_9PEZI|nr:hypothetical protein F5X68DRAFT_141421 [Plectosphaerella plurivora]
MSRSSEGIEPGPPRPPTIRRHIKHACDSCKRRKAKCDGQSPKCSSCRALGVECCYSLPRAKRGPKPRASRSLPASASDVASENSATSPDYALGPGLGTVPVSELGPGCPQSSSNDASSVSISTLSNSLAGTSSPWTPVGFVTTPAGTTQWPGTPRAFHRGDSPQDVHEHLTSFIESEGVELEPLAFPLIPCFCPRTALESVPLLLPTARHRFKNTLAPASTGEPASQSVTIEDIRAYSLLTAFCAQMLCRVQEDAQMRGNQAHAHVFLACSRGMLLFFEDHDVSQPGLYSPIIRMVHSSVFHCLGKNRMSRFLVGQALRLSVDMRLFDESSVETINAQEAQLRRNIFWIMYTVDKSLSMLNNLPPTLYDRLIDPAHLERNPDNTPVRLLDGLAESRYHASYEAQLRQAFDLTNKQWLLAGDIVRDLDLINRLGSKSASRGPAVEHDGLSALKKDVTRSYTGFCSLLDTTPQWVSEPDSHAPDGQSEEATKVQRLAFWSQHANLIVTYHCLKLILMVKAFKLGFAALLGLADNEELFALRNTEVAYELVNDAARIPLLAFRANGEAMVEKLRQVGVILLEISHRVSSEAIATRAKALFGRLLDIIARLDSKSSDNFGEEAP